MTEHDLTRTSPHDLRRARRMFLIVAIVVPLILTGVGVAVLLSWMPELPDPVVTHWGLDGPDGYGAPLSYVWMLIAFGFGLPALSAVTTLLSVGTHWGPTARFMGATAAGLAALMLVVMVGSVAPQRGVTDASQVGGIWGVVLVALGVVVAVSVVAWAVQPRIAPTPGRALAPAHAVEVAAGERVVWVGTTTMSRGALVMLGATLLLLVLLTIVQVVAGAPSGWVTAGVAVLVGLAVAATAAYRVRVTPQGFVARSLIGWPRVDIPASEVTSVRAVDIDPFGEFGGWGWRIGLDGRQGIVTRKGPAIEIARSAGRTFVVTIDGAPEAAALLQAYIEPTTEENS